MAAFTNKTNPITTKDEVMIAYLLRQPKTILKYVITIALFL